MASVARLPSLQCGGGKVTQQVVSQIPKPPKGGTPKRKKASKNGLENNSDDLGKSKIDTQRYRNSYMHNLCLDMLKEGFHLSYCELFNLIKNERERRIKVAEDTGLIEPFLEEQPDKLEELKLNLTAAETGKRRGKMDVVYGCYLSLAVYFENSKDIALTNHFYKLGLEASVKVRGDGRRKEAEANYNMGIALEKQEALYDAAQCFENFHHLTNGRLWQSDVDGKKMFSTACECLQRIYTSVARQLRSYNLSESIEYLSKAYKVSKEGDDIGGQGEACYILGCAHYENDDAETALLYHNEYFKICKQMDDVSGMGKACRALAKCCEKQMDIEAAIKHLESFVELSQSSGIHSEQRTACSSIGEMLNSLGKYEDSSSYCEKAYKFSKKIENDKKKESVRAQYGIVKANMVLHDLTQAMNFSQHNSIDMLLNWKQSRKLPTDATRSDQQAETVETNENQEQPSL